MKLWKRFIDDCLGIFLGKTVLLKLFYNMIVEQFSKYDLQLTNTISNNSIEFLDVEIFISEGLIHTKEFRKETSSNHYLKYGSAHSSHTFSGIVKSQMYRLRRLCSRDEDFNVAISNLRTRCLRSGYSEQMVDSVLSTAPTLIRNITVNTTKKEVVNDCQDLKWITLSGTTYEKDISLFTSRMNNILKAFNIKMQVIKSNGPTISQVLYNNSNVSQKCTPCNKINCYICKNGLRGKEDYIISTTNGNKYPVSQGLSCNDAGIYVCTVPCKNQYTGKTTTTYDIRSKEHLNTATSVNAHLKGCLNCQTSENPSQFYFMESYLRRGKYTLSEREFLWNERIRSSINSQKTLKS